MGLETALLCLALNIFKEARGEPELGQFAVAMVTLNRTTVDKGICDVVLEPNQFSWTATDTFKGVVLPGRLPNAYEKEWQRAYRIASESLYMRDFTNGATHYHNRSVQPPWSANMKVVARIGGHVFYRGR